MDKIEQLKVKFRQDLFELTGEDYKVTIISLRQENLKLSKIIDLVSEYYGITRKLLTAKVRKEVFITRRYICFKIITNECRSIIYADIGRAFNMKHSSIIAALDKFDDFYKNEPKFLEQYQNVNKFVLENLK